MRLRDTEEKDEVFKDSSEVDAIFAPPGDAEKLSLLIGCRYTVSMATTIRLKRVKERILVGLRELNT